jgi:hypothetical protein
VDKVLKTLAKLASSFTIFTRQVRKRLAKTIERVSERENKPSPDSRRVGFVFLLANPEFYSHLASWRVVIRTPANYSRLPNMRFNVPSSFAKQ